MLELAICCISMIGGKTNDSPASACGPMRPTKWASTVAVTAINTTLTTTFGAARRSSVATIGPSRRRRVRAAAGLLNAGVADPGTADALALVMALVMALLPLRGGAALGRNASLGEAGRLQGSPTARHLVGSPMRGKAWFLGRARSFLMISGKKLQRLGCYGQYNRLHLLSFSNELIGPWRGACHS